MSPSSSSESRRILRRTNPNDSEESSTPTHIVRDANRMGDLGDVGVGRVGVKGVKGVKRVNDVGDDDKGASGDDKDNNTGDEDKGDEDKGDNDKGDDNDVNDDVGGNDEAGVGRGRIRRALCVDDTVYRSVIGGRAGKARARGEGVTFFIDVGPGNLLPSILAGNSPLGDLWRAPRGWRVKVALSLM